MSNTSAAPGWLTPIDGGPVYDADLNQLLCGWVAGVSGLAPEEVRPAGPQPLPQSGASIEVVAILRDESPGYVHQQDASVTLKRSETLSCRVQFYGSAAQATGCRFLDGLSLNQNQSELQRLGLSCSRLEPLQALQTTDTQPVKYQQAMLHLSRTVHRDYGVMTLTQAPLFLTGESL